MNRAADDLDFVAVEKILADGKARYETKFLGVMFGVPVVRDLRRVIFV